MNLKQGRAGKRVLKMVRTWNRTSGVSHDADKITESMAGKNCIRTLKYI